LATNRELTQYCIAAVESWLRKHFITPKMKGFSSVVLLALASSARAFAPARQSSVYHNDVALNMAASSSFSKRKVALKILTKATGVVGSAALVLAAAPPANAAKTVKAVAPVVETVSKYGAIKKVAGLASVAAVVGGAFSVLKKKSQKDKVIDKFPGAIPNSELVSQVKSALSKYGYGASTLLCTAFCCDELNRALDKDLSAVYDNNFSMGGLAGLPWGGVTSFGAMAAHIPDGGSCLVVYGPHVGVDSQGNVGRVERPGQMGTDICCGSAADAANYVAKVYAGGTRAGPPPVDSIDAQQAYVRTVLLPHAARLHDASEPSVELPFALFDASDDLMKRILSSASSTVAGDGKIALLGGIQVNTPEGSEDFFLPLKFEVRNNQNRLVEDLITSTFA